MNESKMLIYAYNNDRKVYTFKMILGNGKRSFIYNHKLFTISLNHQTLSRRDLRQLVA